MKLDVAAAAPRAAASAGGASGAGASARAAGGAQQGQQAPFARMVGERGAGPAGRSPGASRQAPAVPEQDDSRVSREQARKRARRQAEEAAPWLAALLADAGLAPAAATGGGKGVRQDDAAQEGVAAPMVQGRLAGRVSGKGDARPGAQGMPVAVLPEGEAGEEPKPRRAAQRREMVTDAAGAKGAHPPAEGVLPKAAPWQGGVAGVAQQAAAAGRMEAALAPRGAPGAGGVAPLAANPDGGMPLGAADADGEGADDGAAILEAALRGRQRRRAGAGDAGGKVVEQAQEVRLKVEAGGQERHLAPPAGSGGGSVSAGAGAAAAAPEAMAAEAARRALDILAERLGMAGGRRPAAGAQAGGGAKVLRNLEIRLHPASLGTVTARLSSGEEGLRIVLVAPSRSIAKEMEKGLEELAGRIRAHHEAAGGRIHIQVETQPSAPDRGAAGGHPGGGEAAQQGAAAHGQGAGGHSRAMRGGSANDGSRETAHGPDRGVPSGAGRDGVLYL